MSVPTLATTPSTTRSFRHVMDVNEIHAAFAPVARPVVAPVRTVKTAADDIADIRSRLDTVTKQTLAAAKRDREATERVKVHLTLVSASMLISVILTFLAGPIAIHLGGVFAGFPSWIQELTDWIEHW